MGLDARSRGDARRRARRAQREFLKRTQVHTPLAAVVARCDQPHSGGRVPKLAEAIQVPEVGFLFVSRISWIPSDELTLRPWMREHLEGAGMDSASFDRCLNDDVFLSDMLHRHDAWAGGLVRTGERWLARGEQHEIVALIEGDPDAQALGLWTRCKAHPKHAENIPAAQFFHATR